MPADKFYRAGMGRKPKRKPQDRDVHGIVLLDKPAGMTANDSLQKIKRLFGAAKAGHTGSLDKPATGLLPLCLGEATKIASFLLEARKIYQVTGHLGRLTSTGDAAGKTLQIKKVPHFTAKDLVEILKQFIGNIRQVPPMYSALKQNGQRLYKLAYQGIEVNRKPRPVTIFKIDLLGVSEETFDLQVHCSKGTYMRTLVEDIGNVLGCGAHVSALRRLAIEPFTQDQMMPIKRLEILAVSGTEMLDRQLIPMDQALTGLARVELPEQAAFCLSRGQPVPSVQALPVGAVRIYDHHGNFMGIGNTSTDGRILPRRLLSHRYAATVAC